MLSCVYNNEDFNNKQEGYNEIQIKELGLSRQLFCPRCNTPVYFCAQGKITSHFKHFGKTCEDSYLYKHDINSERHFKATEIFYTWIKSQYPNAKIIKDKYLVNENQEQKADLYFETGDSKIIFELQFRHINFTDLLARREFYKNLGIKDIWIFVKSGFYAPGTPYERYYYRDNNRELYFYEEHTGKFTYFKGLKTDNFINGALVRFVSNTCALGAVVINSAGFLELPKLREKHFEKIAEIRSRLHNRIRIKKNVFKKAASVKSIINAKPDIEKPQEQKMHSESYIFHQIKYYNKDGKNFASISYIDDNGELVSQDFIYKSKNESINEINMICKRPDDEKTVYDVQIINSPTYKKIRIVSFS